MRVRLLLFLAASLLAGCTSRQQLPPVASDAPDAQRVTWQARQQLGVPYRWGGNTPAQGFDCSGLIVYVYDQALGMRLPRTTGQMLSMQLPQPPRWQLREGDLVFFDIEKQGRVSHAGIYLGNSHFIHAPRPGAVVRIESLDTNYWRPRYLGARRILVD